MDACIRRVFGSNIAKRGGFVRRRLSLIDRCTTRSELKSACKGHGYHIVEHGDQWLIYCDPNVRLVGL
jgi:hypothetical protein